MSGKLGPSFETFLANLANIFGRFQVHFSFVSSFVVLIDENFWAVRADERFEVSVSLFVVSRQVFLANESIVTLVTLVQGLLCLRGVGLFYVPSYRGLKCKSSLANATAWSGLCSRFDLDIGEKVWFATALATS